MNEHVIVARTCGPFSDIVDYSAHETLFLGNANCQKNIGESNCYSFLGYDWNRT